MRRCTSCFRFQAGAPTYCAYCGRSFDVRICSGGHRNPRGVQYCSECGSADLSTPSPPASLGFRLAGILLYTFGGLTAGLIAVTILFAVFKLVDWQRLSGPLVMLVLTVAFLYWTTTLLPGPVKKVGKAAGHQFTKTMQRDKRR